jgi:hypothetical protein
MKLPSNVLQGLAAAVACVGVAGCTVGTAAPSGPQPASSQNSNDPSVDPSGVPHEAPGNVCQPDGCPNCGRG